MSLRGSRLSRPPAPLLRKEGVLADFSNLSVAGTPRCSDDAQELNLLGLPDRALHNIFLDRILCTARLVSKETHALFKDLFRKWDNTTNTKVELNDKEVEPLLYYYSAFCQIHATTNALELMPRFSWNNRQSANSNRRNPSDLLVEYVRKAEALSDYGTLWLDECVPPLPFTEVRLECPSSTVVQYLQKAMSDGLLRSLTKIECNGSLFMSTALYIPLPSIELKCPEFSLKHLEIKTNDYAKENKPNALAMHLKSNVVLQTLEHLTITGFSGLEPKDINTFLLALLADECKINLHSLIISIRTRNSQTTVYFDKENVDTLNLLFKQGKFKKLNQLEVDIPWWYTDDVLKDVPIEMISEGIKTNTNVSEIGEPD